MRGKRYAHLPCIALLQTFTKIFLSRLLILLPILVSSSSSPRSAVSVSVSPSLASTPALSPSIKAKNDSLKIDLLLLARPCSLTTTGACSSSESEREEISAQAPVALWVLLLLLLLDLSLLRGCDSHSCLVRNHSSVHPLGPDASSSDAIEEGDMASDPRWRMEVLEGRGFLGEGEEEEEERLRGGEEERDRREVEEEEAAWEKGDRRVER